MPVFTVDSLLWWLGTPSNITYVDDALGGLESNARITCMFPNDLHCTYRISRTCHLPYVFTFHGEAGSLSFATNSIAAYSVTTNARTTRYECDGGPKNELSCWQDQMRDFIDSIQNRRDPLVSGEEGERAMALIEQCYAMKRQRPLPARAPLPGVMW